VYTLASQYPKAIDAFRDADAWQEALELAVLHEETEEFLELASELLGGCIH